jgi:hypothetical protein
MEWIRIPGHVAGENAILLISMFNREAEREQSIRRRFIGGVKRKVHFTRFEGLYFRLGHLDAARAASNGKGGKHLAGRGRFLKRNSRRAETKHLTPGAPLRWGARRMRLLGRPRSSRLSGQLTRPKG